MRRRWHVRLTFEGQHFETELNATDVIDAARQAIDQWHELDVDHHGGAVLAIREARP
jgi:hypothetical protein